MKKLVLAIAVIAAIYGWQRFNSSGDSSAPAIIASSPAINIDDRLESAFQQQRSGVQVTGEGIVTRILDDDSEGSRHQRFILRLASGRTLLVAHNVDLAPRIATLNPGDTVAFNGEYEWNEKGGLIHWTHRDPNGQHEAGWLKHNGETYQ
jgi:hypothetical protein